MNKTSAKNLTPRNNSLYKFITYLYLASIIGIFLFTPHYIGVVFATMIFWLSLRGIFFKNLLMGSSVILSYGPLNGTMAKIFSFFLFLIAMGLYYWLFAISGLRLNLLGVATIFIYLPLVMLLGMYLKKKL